MKHFQQANLGRRDFPIFDLQFPICDLALADRFSWPERWGARSAALGPWGQLHRGVKAAEAGPNDFLLVSTGVDLIA